MAETKVPDNSLSTGSEPVYDIVCQPCGSEGKNAEAESYCLECCEHLCVQCVGGHKKFAGLQHHTLLNKQSMPQTQGVPKARDVCTKRCQIHKDEIIKYFCPTHKFLGCGACVTLKHPLCGDVIYIPEVVSGLEDSRHFKKFMAKLNGLTQRSKDTTKFAEDSKKLASDHHDQVTQKIDAYKQYIIAAVDKQVKEMKDRAKHLHTKDTGKMNSLADDSNKVLTELQSISSDLSLLKDKKQFCQLFVEMKIKEQRLTELQGKLEDLEGEHVSDYDFQVDDQVPTMIRRTDGLGELVVKKAATLLKGKAGSLHQATSETLPQDNTESLLQTESKTEAEGKKPSVIFQDLQQRSATHVANIRVSEGLTATVKQFLGYNWDYLISGVALLSTELLVVADYFKDTIKLINVPTKKVISKFKTKYSPWDVTVCVEEVVATLPLDRKIIFLKCANGQLFYVRDFRANGHCKGIDFANDKLFVTYDMEQKLEVMTITGTILQRIDKNDQGGQLFKNPEYVMVSVANQSIYVSEEDEGKVTVLGLDGKVKGEYSNRLLGGPKQLAVDSAGVMYLCDYSNDTIHLLSPLSQKVKVLLTDQHGLDGPRSVSYCESTGRLYVGMDNNNIKVFQVS